MAGYFEEIGLDAHQDDQTPKDIFYLFRFIQDMHVPDEALTVDKKLSPPASKAAIEALTNMRINDPGVECPVCLKDFDINTQVKKMPCKHIFHFECIIPWLNKTNSCPLCRHELPTDDKTYEEFKTKMEIRRMVQMIMNNEEEERRRKQEMRNEEEKGLQEKNEQYEILEMIERIMQIRE